MKKNIKNPFKTPEGYFDGFQDKLMDKLSNKESVNTSLKDGFKVPEGYFNTVEENINKRLNEDVNVIQLRSYKKYYVAAASIAAIALVVFGLNWNRTKDISFTDLANADIEAYFDSNEIELSSYEIAEVMPVDQLEIDDILDTRMDEENILDYLNENIEDFEELNLEDNE